MLLIFIIFYETPTCIRHLKVRILNVCEIQIDQQKAEIFTIPSTHILISSSPTHPYRQVDVSTDASSEGSVIEESGLPSSVVKQQLLSNST